MARILGFVVAALAMATTAVTASKVIPIQVLDDKFEPNTTTADAGDILEFYFQPHNHSVVEGDFSDACQPAKTGGFYSGFFALSEGEAVSVPLPHVKIYTFPPPPQGVLSPNLPQ